MFYFHKNNYNEFLAITNLLNFKIKLHKYFNNIQGSLKYICLILLNCQIV